MRKIISYGVIVLLFALLVVAFSQEERLTLKACQNECREEKSSAYEGCFAQYDACGQSCLDARDSCNANIAAGHADCIALCGNQNKTVLELNNCKKQCDKQLRDGKRFLCDPRDCKNSCYNEKKDCLSKAHESYSFCRNACKYDLLNISCGEYAVGEKYRDGCSTCECSRGGEIVCKKDLNCGFDNFSVDQESCIDQGSLFQPVCKGPYFRLRCTRESYCICEDDAGCPDGSFCLKEFFVNVNSAVEGWKGLQGEDLGEIGICTALPEIASCGNGICEVKCDLSDCSVAENAFSCPEDC